MTEPSRTRTPGVPCVPGAPSWVSLLAHDPTAAQAFYGPLLGWHFETVAERWGPYAHAITQGIKVAGIGALPDGWRSPATWTTFFGVNDIDDAARRVRERIGTVGIGPMDFTSGRVAIAVDPTSAVFGLWQGPTGPARQLQMAGAPAWIELSTDAFAAALFYGDVLDWAGQDAAHLEVYWEHERVVLRVDGRKVAALRTSDAGAGAAAALARPHWHVSFSVVDLDSATDHALRLGGGMVSPPQDSPYGRFAALRDPEGAPFSLITPP